MRRRTQDRASLPWEDGTVGTRCKARACRITGSTARNGKHLQVRVPIVISLGCAAELGCHEVMLADHECQLSRCTEALQQRESACRAGVGAESLVETTNTRFTSGNEAS